MSECHTVGRCLVLVLTVVNLAYIQGVSMANTVHRTMFSLLVELKKLRYIASNLISASDCTSSIWFPFVASAWRRVEISERFFDYLPIRFLVSASTFQSSLDLFILYKEMDEFLCCISSPNINPMHMPIFAHFHVFALNLRTELEVLLLSLLQSE